MHEQTLYQPIQLDCWQQIRAVTLTAIHVNTNSNEYHVHRLTRKNFGSDLANRFENELLELYGLPFTMHECLVFQSRPFENPSIHVDGNNEDRAGSNDVALNVPILNCEGTEMIWYSGDYTVKVLPVEVNKKVSSLIPEWHSGPDQIYHKEITSPALVRVNVPHCVINPQEKPRIMASFRFTPGLTFLDDRPGYPVRY